METDSLSGRSEASPPPRHVVIDLLASRSGGALNYTRNLIPLLQRRGAFRYTLIIRPSQRAAFGFVPGQFAEISAPESTERPLTRLAWSQAALPWLLKRHHVDVLFAPTDHPPLWVPCPLVMAVRNPTPYTETATVSEGGRRARERVMRFLTRVAAQRARRVIFVSHSAAVRINAFLRVPEERIRVVYHGLDPVIANGAGRGPTLELPAEFALAVSSFYHYKNYLGLVQALEMIRAREGVEIPVLICGREIDRQNVDAVRREIARLRLPVSLLGEVGPTELAALYRRARILVFPSYLETFGHPLVEAMASGTAVTAGDIPTSREICGEAASFFDPHHPGDIARAVYELWTNADRREELRELGLLRSQGFSWERCAQQTEGVIAEALRPHLASRPDLR